jgi:hypothetical protein
VLAVDSSTNGVIIAREVAAVVEPATLLLLATGLTLLAFGFRPGALDQRLS